MRTAVRFAGAKSHVYMYRLMLDVYGALIL